MGRYRSLQVIMHLYGIQWFLMGPYRSLCVLMGPLKTHWKP